MADLLRGMAVCARTIEHVVGGHLDQRDAVIGARGREAATACPFT